MNYFVVGVLSVIWLVLMVRLTHAMWCLMRHKEHHYIVPFGDDDRAVMVCRKCRLVTFVKRRNTEQ